MTEYAERYIEDTGMLEGLPRDLRCYFVTQAFGRDLVRGGDISEVEISGSTWIVQAA